MGIHTGREIAKLDRVTMYHPPYRQIVSAFPLYPCYILAEFDGSDYRIIDLSSFLERHEELFEPLSRWEFFRQVKVEDDTIAFPNGLDFDPAFLYAESKPFDTEKIVHAISES